MKVTAAMAALALPLLLAGRAFYGLTLALGVWAAALSETADHPRGRIKAIAVMTLTFAVTTTAVSLLTPYRWIFGAGLFASTVLFVLIGGVGERYRGITFGAILIGIYAMLGRSISPAWYWQPVLLSGGALFYGMVSLAFLVFRPWRPLQEELSRGFIALSSYLDEKARLFPSEDAVQAEIRNSLAILNVRVVESLERCKEVLNSYGQETGDQAVLSPYLERFMLLQALHERAASSHERYDLLSRTSEERELLSGLGESLRQLAYACRLVADNLLTGTPYRHPPSLSWIVEAIRSRLEEHPEAYNPSLVLLLHNLYRSHLSLSGLNGPVAGTSIPRLSRDDRPLLQRFFSQIRPSNPRLRFAVRLAAALLAGYALYQSLHIPKGAWILLTTLFVSLPTFSETRRRLIQRVAGTTGGVAAAILIIQILPTVPGQVLLLFAASYLFFRFKQSNYSLAVVFVTIFVFCIFNLISAEGVEVMLPRFVNTVIGAALAILSVVLMWPEWQYRRLPALLAEALSADALYFRSILASYGSPAGDDFDYRVARRRAHRADNELALSWQSMRLEPKRVRRYLEHAYRLTYLNHALVSYLSALGAHRDTFDLAYDALHDFADQIEGALVEAGSCLSGRDRDPASGDLTALLLDLRNTINGSNDPLIRQQARIIYNIADVTSALLAESVKLLELDLHAGRRRL